MVIPVMLWTYWRIEYKCTIQGPLYARFKTSWQW